MSELIENNVEPQRPDEYVEATVDTARSQSRRRPRIISFLIIAALVLVGLVAGFAYYLNTPAGTSDAEVPFTVRKGESLDSIADRLAQQHLIRSQLLLKVLGRVSGTSSDAQAGHYGLRATMATSAIYGELLKGRQLLVRVTIPEGYTMSQIAQRMAERGITSRSAFLAAARDDRLLAQFHIPAKNAEGYLFPDTYLFPEDYPAGNVVSHMIQNFYSRLKEIYPAYETLSPKQLFDKIILASIVEREYVSADEAPLIASVFYNRLRAHMRLESCATVVYVMTEQEGLPHPDRLYYRDLDRPSPYNTYLHSGLPPGPISNPGLTALKASFFPAKTDYWYFVLKSEGATHHHFSRSLEDHNRAAVYYLKTLNTHS